jgi:hypothetical protein
MSRLAARRLADLHKRFYEAARGATLRHAVAIDPHALNPQGDETWPHVPWNGEGFTIGFSDTAWYDIMGREEKREHGRLAYENHFLMLDKCLWQGTFLADWRPPEGLAGDAFMGWLRITKRRTARAMKRFRELAEEACDAVGFERYLDPPDAMRDPAEDLRRDRKSDRWLELVYILLQPRQEDFGWCRVRRLPGCICYASTLALEKIDDQRQGKTRVKRLTRESRRTMLQAALATHHRSTYHPATIKDLRELTGWDASRVSRAMQDLFGSMASYHELCRTEPVRGLRRKLSDGSIVVDGELPNKPR